MHWYKRDPNAFLSGTMMLTLEERGAYSTIIDHYYACDGKVLDDDYRISCIMNCNPRTWRRLKLALFQKQKLSVHDGYLVPNRGEYTLNEARTMSERQSNRARSRWERDEINNDINDNSMRGRNAITATATSRKKESDSDSGLAKKEIREERLVIGEYDFVSDDGFVFVSAEEFRWLEKEYSAVANPRGLVREACRKWLKVIPPADRKRRLFAWFAEVHQRGGLGRKRKAEVPTKQEEAEAEAYRLRREEGARAAAFRRKQDEERRQRKERANGAVSEPGQFPPVGEGGRDQKGDIPVPGL